MFKQFYLFKLERDEKKVNTVVVRTDVVIPPDQLQRKCLRSTHYWRDVIIVLMKKCSLADKKLKTCLFDAMRIEC